MRLREGLSLPCGLFTRCGARPLPHRGAHVGSQDVLPVTPRRTLPSPTTKPLAGSTCAHFQPRTNPAIDDTEIRQKDALALDAESLPRGRRCEVRGGSPYGAPACGGALRCLPSALRSREPLRVLRGATLIRVCSQKHPPARRPDRRIGGVLSEVNADAVGPREALESGDEGALRLLDDGRHGAGMGTKRAAARTRGLEPALQRY